MKIYIAGSISGQEANAVLDYFGDMKKLLTDFGYEVLSPMTAKGYFRNSTEYKAHGYDMPVSTNHAIVERDRWMVSICDILYCNLTMAKIVSIGSVMELAWAHHMGKHTIVAMPQDNIHMHAFVIEAADILFHTHEEVIDYLRLLGGGLQ